MVAQVEVVGEVGVREVLEQQGEVLLAIPGVQVREKPPQMVSPHQISILDIPSGPHRRGVHPLLPRHPPARQGETGEEREGEQI